MAPKYYLTDFLKEAQAEYKQNPDVIIGTVIGKIQEALLWLDESDNKYYRKSNI